MIVLDAELYSIELYSRRITVDEYKKLCNMFRYYCEKSGISFLAIYSTTDSAISTTISQRTGERGRPVCRVYGKKVPPHLHSCFLGTKDKSAFSTVRKIKSRLDKRYGRRIAKVVPKGRTEHAINFITYALRQADMYRSYGDFDFLSVNSTTKSDKITF